MLATVGANEAAGYQLSTGDAVMAIGGFNGTDPAPTLAEFEKLVAGRQDPLLHRRWRHRSRPGGAGRPTSRRPPAQITSWVEAHFASTTVGGVTVYNLATTDGAARVPWS